jgi:hypothetical protein
MNQLLKEFNSADKKVFEQVVDIATDRYPIEYLNTTVTSGMPLSKLKLKIGCALMILCNLNPSNGVCNGTHAILTNFTHRVLEVKVLGGDHNNKKVLIPCISMTINKSQGQSVKNVGLDLRHPVFTHGQFYVAASRCTSLGHIKVLFPEGSECSVATNIVYKNVLLKESSDEGTCKPYI